MDNDDRWRPIGSSEPEVIPELPQVTLPTWDESLYIIQPEYSIRKGRENYEKGTVTPDRLINVAPGVLTYDAWEKDQTFNGVQDRDMEYDKYLFSMWKTDKQVYQEGYRMSEKRYAQYLNALNEVMTAHRNQWNEKQEYWNSRRKAGIQSEDPKFTYTVEKSRTRSSMENLELTSEEDSGISPVSNSKLPAVGMTQIREKGL